METKNNEKLYEKILDILMNSRLDETGLCICSEDLEKILEEVNEIKNTQVSEFDVRNPKKKIEKGRLAYYDHQKNSLIFYMQRLRSAVRYYLKLDENQKKLAKLNHEEYELLVKAIVMHTILHEFEHVAQFKIMDYNEIDNPDYLLLMLGNGGLKHKLETNPVFREIMERNFGKAFGRMNISESYGALML